MYRNVAAGLVKDSGCIAIWQRSFSEHSLNPSPCYESLCESDSDSLKDPGRFSTFRIYRKVAAGLLKVPNEITPATAGTFREFLVSPIVNICTCSRSASGSLPASILSAHRLALIE